MSEIIAPTVKITVPNSYLRDIDDQRKVMRLIDEIAGVYMKEIGLKADNLELSEFVDIDEREYKIQTKRSFIAHSNNVS